jgi:squalene cyclase
MSVTPRDSMRAARTFLLGSQAPDGSWKDFLLPAGNSNVWVTAFVAGVLGDCEEARLAWCFLQSAARDGGGWSYNVSVPGDADSTLWALRLAETLGEHESSAAREGRAFLEQHFREDGGLATYATAVPIRKYIGLPPIVPFDGWTASHTCVTAACANLSVYRDRLRAYLLARRREDGSWPAYWWFDDEFATAEAVAAIGADEQSIAWASRRIDSATTPFALAHALRIVARGAKNGVADRAIARLISMQREDGSWPASARLRVPRPDMRVPDPHAEWTMWAGMNERASTESVLRITFNNYSPDHYGVYTTATVLRALQEAAG